MADIENPALGIENWHLGRLFKALFTFGSILIHFRIFGFFRFFLILAYFPYVFWGPKMTKYYFFQLFPKWPVWVEKMCSGVLEGPSTCGLPISKLITVIFHYYKKNIPNIPNVCILHTRSEKWMNVDLGQRVV